MTEHKNDFVMDAPIHNHTVYRSLEIEIHTFAELFASLLNCLSFYIGFGFGLEFKSYVTNMENINNKNV